MTVGGNTWASNDEWHSDVMLETCEVTLQLTCIPEESGEQTRDKHTGRRAGKRTQTDGLTGEFVEEMT